MSRTDNVQLSDLLMKLYGNSDEAIFFFDGQGKVLAMNAAAEEILAKDVYEQMMAGSTGAICKACKGYTSSAEPQTCVSCYMANPDEDISSFQVYFDTKGRGVIPYSGSIQTIDEETGTRVFMLRDLTYQYKTQEELNRKLMMQRVIKAQEDERKRISRELHDSVAQEMLSSLVDLRVLKYMNIEEDVLKKVQQTEGSLMRLLDDIRTCPSNCGLPLSMISGWRPLSALISNGWKRIMVSSSISIRSLNPNGMKAKLRRSSTAFARKPYSTR